MRRKNRSWTRRGFLEAATAAGMAGLLGRRLPSEGAFGAEGTASGGVPGGTPPAAPAAVSSTAGPLIARYRLGCYTRPWDAYEYRVALDGIAAAGYRYAGLMTAKCETWVLITADTSAEEAAQIGEEVKRRGLETISLYGGDFPVAKSVEAGIAGLRRLIENCVACGSPDLLLGGTADAKIFDAYYQVVRECCDYAASRGVRMSVKPHGGQNATGPQCRRIIERVGHPSFRLWYDPGNIFYYSDGEVDPVDDAATVDRLVCGMSVKDFLPPKDVLVTPGTGRVDFRAVLAALGKGGFVEGPLVVECLAKGEAEQVTAEARKAREFLEDLTGQGGAIRVEGAFVSLDGRDPLEALTPIAALGFSAVEIYLNSFGGETERKLRSALDRLRLRPLALFASGPGPQVYDFERGPETIGLVPRGWRAERIAALREASDFAKRLGIPAVETHIGFTPENPGDPLYRETVEAAREVASHARANGQTFLYHAGQETPVTMLRLIRDVGLDNQGIGLDTANLILYGKGHPTDALDVYGKLVRQVNAKDGLYPTDPKRLGKEVPIGEGRVDFPRFFRRLAEVGYEGPVVIEREISGPQLIEDLRRSKATIEGILADVAGPPGDRGPR